MKRSTLLYLFVLLGLFSCDKEKYSLQWKVPEGEVLIYKIQMETIDSLSSVSEENMRELVKLVAGMYGDSINLEIGSNDLYQGLIRQLNLLSYFSILRQGGTNGEMKIDFLTRQNKEYSQLKYLDIFRKYIRKALFKGSLSRNGKLLSENGGDVFDPKINILFELPEKPVSVGDTWALNIDFSAMHPKLSKQDSIVNKVTFVDLQIDGKDSIAVLEYQLQGPESTGRALNYTGKGLFNINKGNWVSYTGTLSQRISGILSMRQVQEIKLSEISVASYKSQIKKAQKVNVFDIEEDVNEMNKDTTEINGDKTELNKEVSQNKSVDCPEVFRVQLLASQQPITDKKKEFETINHQIDEIVISETEKFKYKYTVGKHCTMEDAKALLVEIKNQGYPSAYIIKTDANL